MEYKNMSTLVLHIGFQCVVMTHLGPWVLSSLKQTNQTGSVGLLSPSSGYRTHYTNTVSISAILHLAALGDLPQTFYCFTHQKISSSSHQTDFMNNNAELNLRQPDIKPFMYLYCALYEFSCWICTFYMEEGVLITWSDGCKPPQRLQNIFAVSKPHIFNGMSCCFQSENMIFSLDVATSFIRTASKQETTAIIVATEPHICNRWEQFSSIFAGTKQDRQYFLGKHDFFPNQVASVPDQSC